MVSVLTTGASGYSDEIRRILSALLAIPSPTGLCGEISREIEQRLDGLGLTVIRKRDGSLIARLAGSNETAPALGYVVHLDTLGAQVKQVKENGRLELIQVGTWSARFAEGARVKVHADGGLLTGTILPVKASGHAFGKKVDEQAVGWREVEVRIDAAVHNRADTIGLGVRPGDFVSIDPKPEFLESGYLVSRFLDDKAAVACLLTAATELAGGPMPARDIHFMFTVSEEIGTGAPGLVNPAVADVIALDIGIVAEGQETREDSLTICMADATGPYDRQLSLEMEAVCKEAELPVTRDVFRFYKSDTASARLSGTDARMALMAFGVDSSHGYERTHIRSLEALTEFLIVFPHRATL
ncbi:osmoprotectant NAGGN system M42 family peptidase [uncultured Roseibium sp.]|uniref:osmoprotectant NAGGN system M42 family peptidase n=1 Tax=uncultured Roseibium sp. TaxID=1936171 RepID=UPI00259A1768|nr:osmoprotectant NAGGN system M42 family peptidase [uncultured Roseibium sp.]